MNKQSAGLLLYRLVRQKIEVFLVHPGGPYWKGKETGAWSIPKGEYGAEPVLEAAIREFREETGVTLSGPFIPLTPIRQKSGKIVQAFAVKGNLDADRIVSNTFFIEWPPRSGRQIQIPEVDKGAWFDLPTAREKINPAQTALLQELQSLLRHHL